MTTTVEAPQRGAEEEEGGGTAGAVAALGTHAGEDSGSGHGGVPVVTEPGPTNARLLPSLLPPPPSSSVVDSHDDDGDGDIERMRGPLHKQMATGGEGRRENKVCDNNGGASYYHINIIYVWDRSARRLPLP